jgi:hypothetical protein
MQNRNTPEKHIVQQNSKKLKFFIEVKTILKERSACFFAILGILKGFND